MASSNKIIDYLGRGPIAVRPAKPAVSDASALVFFETTEDGTIYTWDFAAKQWVPWASAGGTYVLPIANSTVLGGVKIDGITTAIGPDGTLRALGTGVSSFNARKGDIALIGDDVVGALAYTPYNGGTNPADFRSGAQVNSAISAALTASLAQNLPQMDGTATIGVATLLAREDHIHPTDTSRYAASNPSNFQNDSQVATAISGALASYVPLSQKGAALGIASLDAAAKIISSQLPAAATGTLNYVSGWNASTNTPTMANGAHVGGSTAPKGNFYAVTVAGTPSIDGIAVWNAGDWIISNGTTWERVVVTTTPYLLLAGGALSLPGTISGIGGLTFTSGDVLGPPSGLLPDLGWGLLDSGGNVGAEFDAAGTMWLASLNAATATLTNATVTLLADPATALGAATRQYVDALRGNTLPIVAGTATAGILQTLARSDHVHPFDPTRAPITSPVFLTSLGFDIETLNVSIEPDIVWSMRDTANGNIVAWLDMLGTFSFASLSAAALSATSISGLVSLAAQTATFSTSATIASETISDVFYPDLIGGVMGANGNLIFGFDAVTGEANAISINAGALKINGAPLNTAVQTAPSDALDVRSAPYNAAIDGVRNHGYVTTSGNLLTIVNFTGTLSLTVVDATTARVDIVGAVWSGWAFQPHHEGKLLYLTAGAYTLLARIKPHGYISGQSVLLDATGLTVTPQTSVSGTIVCPAIDTTKSTTGKALIIEGMGKYQWWQQTPTVARQTDNVTPYGVQTWYTKAIANFTAPNQITITGSFPFNWTNQPCVALWGTDDSAAVLAAGLDAWPLKKRVWFSGDGLCLMPGAIGDNAARPSYSTPPAINPGPLFNGCVWGGDNASVYVLTGGGVRMPHRVSPASAPRYNDARKTVHGRLSFPRCAQIPAGQTINVLFDGDSLSAFNPQGQLAAVMGATRFIAEFIAQNPGKKIAFYNVGVGGATWASIASQQLSYNSNSGNPYKYFTIPKPIAGTVKHFAFWSNINQTGTGPAIVPDCVVMFCNAGNDKMSIDGNCMHAVINQIRNVAHGDTYGPTDFVMQCDHHATMILAYSDGVSGGSALPGQASPTMQEFYNGGLNRTTALNMGFPLIDYQPLQERQAWGFDPTRRAMRQVPKVTVSPTPATPVSLGEECLDFAAGLNMNSVSDAVGWSVAQQIEFQISPHPANRLFLRRGTNGTIWAASSTYGRFVDTTVTCSPASRTITLGAATSYPANVTFRGAWPQIDCVDGSIAFDAGMNGQCVIAATGNYDGLANGRPLQRNHIRMVMDANDAMVDQVAADNADVAIASTLPILIGPNQFIPQDSLAQPDVVIIYPDGTVQNTQVAYGGYISATQATLVDAPVQTLTGQTVSLFVGRMGMKWFDTGITPSGTSNTGYVAFSVIRGEFQIGYIVDPTTAVPQVYAIKTLERFGGAFNPVIFSKAAQPFTLANRYIDDDIPIAASTPAWYQRGIIDTNSDYFQGGTGGHYGSMMQPAVLDTLYAHQNLSVN
jgi:hypothetical protein